MQLTSENVHETFMYCLFADGEDHNIYKEGDGVKLKVGFHPGRLQEKENDIIAMLDGLHDGFKMSGGGGWSFLNMFLDKNMEQWTDFHSIVDELIVLGNAIGKVQFQLPRDIWSALPGGMPYVVYDDVKKEHETNKA